MTIDDWYEGSETGAESLLLLGPALAIIRCGPYFGCGRGGLAMQGVGKLHAGNVSSEGSVTVAWN